MVMTAIGMATTVSVDGVAITIASGERLNMTTGRGPSIGSLIFTRNRYTSRHRLTMSPVAHLASVCISRSIFVGKHLQFASQNAPSCCPVDEATLYGAAQT